MSVAVTPRNFAGLAAAFGVTWFAALVLGEYPFRGVTPILGGFLVGVSAISTAAWVDEAEDPPPWVTILGGLFAAWAMYRAAWIDAGAETKLVGLVTGDGGAGPLPGVAYWAMLAALLGALARILPKPQRAAAPADEADADEEEEPDAEPDEEE
ncbi:MAG: hypothetical protein HYU28_03030 [Actinobacteria bacterium]|nr:hypothetical protein [Actinomycetota bacterium]